MHTCTLRICLATKRSTCHLYADTASDDPVVMKIGGGEFAFIPAKNDQTLKAYGTDVDQMVECAVFGLDSSAVKLT